MSERERQAIVKALKAIASAFSFCDTDMELALRDRLNTIHEAIGELANDGSAPKNGVSDAEVDTNDADAASVSFSSVTETGNGDNGAACKANSETCLTGQAVDKQADSTTREVDSTTELLSDETDSREQLEQDIEWCCLSFKDQAPYLVDFIFKWLDRQAAITEEETRCRWVVATADEIARLRDENMSLAHDLGECMADRDELREKLSTVIAHARCIARLIELG